jgi:hypothetical protein
MRYVDENDIFSRLLKHRSGSETQYMVKILSNSDFCQVTSLVKSSTQFLFKVYTGTEERYTNVVAMVRKASEQLQIPFSFEEWGKSC